METVQPKWPPNTFEKIFTPILVLIGIYALFLLLSGDLLLLLSVFALIVGIAVVVIAVLCLAAKTLWQTFFG